MSIARQFVSRSLLYRMLLSSTATGMLASSSYATPAKERGPFAPPIVSDWAKHYLVGDCNGHQPDYTIHEKPNRRPVESESFLYGTTVDGMPAIVANVSNIGHFACGFEGSAGAPLAVFIKFPGVGWRIALNTGAPVRGHEWWKHGRKDRLLLWLHGSYCNGYGASECWTAQELDALSFREVKRHADYKGADTPFGDDGMSGGFSDQPGNLIRHLFPKNELVNPRQPLTHVSRH